MPTVFSIYSGGGGIDLGFKAAGFDIIYATDFEKTACETLIKNNVDTIIECKDIREVDCKKILYDYNIKEIDCLVGGPPCPAYSKSRFYLTEKKRALEDENSFTLHEYFRVLEELNPKVFFFENVNGFIFKPHKEAFDLLEKESERLGYEISHKVINAANYGVPQIRQRFICVGIKKGHGAKFIFPEETHSEKQNMDGKLQWVNCGDILNDIDFDLSEDKEMEAGSKHKDLLKLVPPGDNYLFFTKERGHQNPVFEWRSRYWSFLLKLSPEKPSWTIQASFSNNMGPFHWKNRFLRIEEIRRIQTFDILDSDDYKYEFCGDFKSQWRQIGNAVPPKLVKVIANAIKEQYFHMNM